MSQILVISGHPDLETSYTNKVILQRVAENVADVDVRHLDQLYPNYQFDIAEEQRRLAAAEVIVLQFPFYWYSVPALMKKWIDDVFHYGFAYGSNGDKLKNKKLILSFTIGGPEESYDALGFNHFPIEELLKPLKQTAYLTGMEIQSPVYSHGMVYIKGVYNTQQEVEQRAEAHATRLVQQLEQLLQIKRVA